MFDRFLPSVGWRLSTPFWVFASYGVALCGTLVVQVALTRTISVHEMGRLAVAIAIAAIFESTVTSRGSETALTIFAREYNNTREISTSTISELFYVDVAWTAITCALFLFGVTVFGHFVSLPTVYIFLLIAGTFSQIVWGTSKAYQTIASRISVQSRAELYSTAIATAIIIISVIFWGGIGYCVGTIFGGLTKSAVGALMLGSNASALRWKRGIFGKVHWKDYFHLGGFGVARTFANFFALQIDILLLAITGGPSAVAYYRVARSVATAPSRVLTPVWILARKVILGGMRHETIGDARRKIFLAALLLGAMGAPIGASLYFFGKPLIGFAFGNAYTAAASATAVLFAGNWAFGVCTGWARFAASIAPRKGMTTLAFMSQSIVCLLLWWLIRPSTPTGMAAIAAVASLVPTVFFWTALLQPHWLVGSKPTQPLRDVEA